MSHLFYFTSLDLALPQRGCGALLQITFRHHCNNINHHCHKGPNVLLQSHCINESQWVPMSSDNGNDRKILLSRNWQYSNEHWLLRQHLWSESNFRLIFSKTSYFPRLHCQILNNYECHLLIEVKKMIADYKTEQGVQNWNKGKT